MRLIAIDAGASYIKGALIDTASGEIERSERVPFPAFMEGLPDGRCEVHPDDIIAAVLGVLAPLVAAAPDVDAIVSCSQMHCFVLVDSHGRAQSNCATWQDTRCDVPRDGKVSISDELRALLADEQVARAGNEFHAAVPLKVMVAMTRSGQSLAGLTPLPIMEFVFRQLGSDRAIVHPTNAAAYGCFDVRKAQWADDMIASAGLSNVAWPDVSAEMSPYGQIEISGRKLKVFPSIGDQQAAIFSLGLRENELALNIATGSQVVVLAANADGGDYQVRPFFNGKFERTITHIPAGRALNALLRMLNQQSGADLEQMWREAEASLAKIEDTDLVAEIQFFPGPCGFGGSLQNLHLGNMSAGHILLASYRAMAKNYRGCAARICDLAKTKTLVFAGGLVRKSAVLQREIHAAFGKPSRTAPHEEDTLYGLLLLAREFEKGKSMGGAC